MAVEQEQPVAVAARRGCPPGRFFLRRHEAILVPWSDRLCPANLTHPPLSWTCPAASVRWRPGTVGCQVS